MAIKFLLPPPTSEPTGIQFRELTPEEIATVEPIFHATGNLLPDPAISTFVGAVEGGQVLAFLVLQIKLHAQPMWIKDGRSELFSRLVSTAEKTILRKVGATWVYLFVDSESRLKELAQAAGLNAEPWVVMSKLVQPEIPKRDGAGLMVVPPPLPDPSDQFPITAEELEQYPGDEAIQ